MRVGDLQHIRKTAHDGSVDIIKTQDGDNRHGERGAG
jgi:hypothetical protein